MKKSIFRIAILISLFSLGLSSCNKDDSSNTDNSTPTNTDPSGIYKLTMDSNVVAEGTSTTKVMMYDNTVNLGGAGSELVVTITNVPVSIGETIEIKQSSGSDGKNCKLTISGTNLIKNGEDEIYWGINGTVTRISATKISFTGVCKEDASAIITHSFEGYVESDAYKVK